MHITVVESPRTTLFTTLARVKGELGISGTDQDERLTHLIEDVSSAITEFTKRPWARQSVTEKQIGYGTTQQMLSVTPIAEVSAVRFHDVTVSGWEITDREAGFLFRADRFDDTRPYDLWVTREPDTRSQGEPAWAEDYIGGYLMPGDDMYISAGGISVVAATSTFTLTETDNEELRFPILVSGEYVRMHGFTEAANNKRFRVLSRTPSDLVVEGTLADETSTEIVILRCRTLPRELEGLALLEMRARYLSATRDPSIVSESIADWSATYSDPAKGDAASFGGLTAGTARGLNKYVRVE